MDVKEWLGADNQIGIDIWKNKYRYHGESFDEWVSRVSGGDENIGRLIQEKKFLFGGRILSNRGLQKTGKKITLSNCYVVAPPEDNIESIFDCAARLARTYSYGGGCGIDISGLSPRGAHINNAAKETSGAVSFMDLYSMVTNLIGQNGRRGALMISISCEHPDVEEFIGLKADLEKVTKANISVRITNEFMEAVREEKPFRLHFTRLETGETIEREVDARAMFYRIAEMNWDYAEPGALFWDHICDWNLLSNNEEFRYAGVNPCAEEPLPAGGSCLLGSMNLSEFVEKPFTPQAEFDFAAFRKAVEISTRALNDVLNEGLPLHPLREQRESVADWRQIGLGIMGLADMLLKLGLTYGGGPSLALCDKIGFAMADTAIETSAALAQEQGKYPKCRPELVTTTPFFEKNTLPKTAEDVKKFGLCNSQLLTIAPTGTLSTMLGISGGIEPVYANYYERKTESLHGKDVYYKIYTPIVDTYMKKNGLKDESELPDFFVTAMTLDYKQRIEMQSIWQQHIDASISSTVNVPNQFTVEEAADLYFYAYEKNLKGITIYRDGCKRTGILSTEGKAKAPAAGEGLARGEIVRVTDDVIGKKRKLMTGCGSLHCIALFDPKTGALVETYLSKGSTGGCNNFMIGLSRMISISARGGMDIFTIVDQLNSTGSCPSYSVRKATRGDTSKGSCCPMAAGYALLDMYNEVQREIEEQNAGGKVKPYVPAKEDKPQKETGVTKESMFCPQCGEPLVFEGGCNLCKACGWSKCH